MNKKKCGGCIEHKNCSDSFSSWIFFMIGLIATVAVRAVTLLEYLNPLYSKIAWYTGISGFLLFFIYKFRVSHARSSLIRAYQLADKISSRKALTEQDYTLINALLCGLTSSKEKINYLFIFVFSAVALILAVYLDLLK